MSIAAPLHATEDDVEQLEMFDGHTVEAAYASLKNVKQWPIRAPHTLWSHVSGTWSGYVERKVYEPHRGKRLVLTEHIHVDEVTFDEA